MHALTRPGVVVPTPGPRVTLVLLRAAVTLHLLSVALQPFLAGLYLSGDFDALAVHATNAFVIVYLSLAQIAAAVVGWLVGRAKAWPVLIAVVLFVAETLQMNFGYARELGLHIPLGVSIVTVTVLFAVAVWRKGMRRPRRPFRRLRKRSAA